MQTFIDAKDTQGQPLYPFVDNVIDDMNDRVGAIRRQNPAADHGEVLKQAYEQAVWANPETRAVLIAQQQAQTGKPAEQLRRTVAAKVAVAGTMPKRGAMPALAPEANLKIGTPESDESIRETYRQLIAQ